jgi:hypothetical protein
VRAVVIASDLSHVFFLLEAPIALPLTRDWQSSCWSEPATVNGGDDPQIVAFCTFTYVLRGVTVSGACGTAPSGKLHLTSAVIAMVLFGVRSVLAGQTRPSIGAILASGNHTRHRHC